LRPLPRAFLGSIGLWLHRLARMAKPKGSVRILYYHSISDAPIRSSVSPAAFAEQMEHLRENGYRVLSLADVVRHITTRTAFAEKCVALTLDDGFKDNYQEAFPILQRAGFPATLFLAASYIGTERLPTLTRTDFVPRPLTWDEVREMHASGIEVGSHTLTHPMLSRVPLDVARREISASKRVIEEALSAPVRFFCYPRGDFTPDVTRLVREAGYLAACTTIPGVNDSAADLFALRRTYVSRRDGGREFEKKLAGAYDLLQHLARLVRRLRGR
jgi:peptidoglycan/xylan/chitin deacetylase (PgdA/CDA1 family)